MELRQATASDAPALAEFAATAFWDTYREIDEPNDIRAYVAEHFHPDVVAAVIANPVSTTLLAEVGSTLIGYAVISQGQAPACVDGPDPIELARFYLGKRFIGHGHGARLMLAVHEEARRLGARTLWLGVYDRNIRAVRFYERFGFVKAGGKEFLFGGQIYIDPIYSARVRDGAWPGSNEV